MKKLALTQDTVVVLKSFDDLRADLPVHTGFDAVAVNLFISGNIVPLVQEFSQVLLCIHSYVHIHI
jgi:hypothetical protein